MKTIIIGTTAINRPDLHKNNIPIWYNWINKINKEKYKIKWFINIDIIQKLDVTFEKTQENFKNIIKDIDVTFLKSEESKGNFLKACQRVSSNIENYVLENNLNKEDVVIFWLEDDWRLIEQVALDLDYIIETYLTKSCYINFSFLKKNYIHALAPNLISYELWEKSNLAAWKKQNKHIDPEHCVGVYYLKHFEKHSKYINNITIITKFKNVTDDFFDRECLNYNNSYYTYDINKDDNIIKNNFIDKESIKTRFNDKNMFIRITCGISSDLGRDYMSNIGLIKDKKKVNFYDDNEDTNNE